MSPAKPKAANRKTAEIGKGKPGPGRPKGTPNKVTASIKQAITEAFDNLGGVPALVRWGQANPDGFYGLWGRLAPKVVVVSGPEGGALVIRGGKE